MEKVAFWGFDPPFLDCKTFNKWSKQKKQVFLFINYTTQNTDLTLQYMQIGRPSILFLKNNGNIYMSAGHKILKVELD